MGRTLSLAVLVSTVLAITTSSAQAVIPPPPQGVPGAVWARLYAQEQHAFDLLLFHDPFRVHAD